MCDPLTAPADAYTRDTDRAEPEVPASRPDWFVQCLARLILLLERLLAGWLPRSSGRPPWWQDRPDLPAGSTQEEAAAVRGAFGNAIAWMCRRRGVGPGHQDWPELSRAIVAFGGSLKGFRAGAPALGLQWWENPNVVPGMIPIARAPRALLPPPPLVAQAPLPPPDAEPVAAAPVLRLASWRRFLVSAGTGPPGATGPPAAGLPILSCLTNGAGARPAPLS
jgi:hypothetical protein